MNLADDVQDFADDLDGIRNGGPDFGGSSDEPQTDGGDEQSSDGSEKQPVGRSDMIDLGLNTGDNDGEDGPWLANFKKVVYVVVALAMFQAVVGPIPIPDAALLYVAAFGFLALGLWAGATKHAELRTAWARFEEWRE